MRVVTDCLKIHEVFPFIQTFKNNYDQSYYYEESLQTLTLKSMEDYCENPHFTFLRIFNEQTNLIIQKTRFDYMIAQYYFDTYKCKKTRKILINEDVLGSVKWKKLIIDVYHDEEMGYIEHWKGVEG